MDCLIGCDPELFVKNILTGKFISGDGMIPGSKEEPYIVDKGAIQVDGLALEFNIDPAKTCVEFVGNVIQVRSILGEHAKLSYPDGILEASPVADFDPEYFESIPFYAKQLGCTPDYNAYTGLMNEPPRGDRPFRTGSGHIHIGWPDPKKTFSDEHIEYCRNVTKQLDIFLGLPSLLWDTDKRRRTLYGQLGAFRPKPYGVEYRVLSNAWLKDNRLIEYVYKQARAAMDCIEIGDYFPIMFDEKLIKFMFDKGRFIAEGLQEFGIALPPEDLWVKE